MNNDLMFSSKSVIWETPVDLFNRLNDQYHFDVDVCALPENAKCATYFTPEVDGLKQEWKGVCWMNPPYGREIGKWVEKAYASTSSTSSTSSDTDRCMVVCLLPARTDTLWFHKFIYGNVRCEVQFIKGRLKFGGSLNSAPFPSMIVVFR